MLKIVLANENRGRGGAERFTIQLGQALQRVGHQVRLACRQDSWLARQGLPFLAIPYRGEIDPASYLAAYQAMGAAPPHIVHCQATRDLALFGPLCRLLLRGASLIKSEHSFLDSAGSAWLRWCYRQCQTVVPVSHALQRQMQEVLTPNLPYQVIYNGMDVPPLTQAIPEQMRDHYWIGYLGSMLESKRVNDVIQACAPLLRTRPQARLLLAGEGPELLALQELAQNLEVQDSIWMPGHIDDPLPYLAGLKVLVQASPRETFSLVALEAMALEVPVVAYAREGLAEVVADGQTGLLSSTLEHQNLTLSIEQYANKEELRRLHGRNGRLRVQQNFSWEVILPQWEALYRSLPTGQAAPQGPTAAH
ncbi:glycosyltransferase family 4 protein [bacterium]|nr:glycosyltransferase family 4 protein [bacterium]